MNRCMVFMDPVVVLLLCCPIFVLATVSETVIAEHYPIEEPDLIEAMKAALIKDPERAASVKAALKASGKHAIDPRAISGITPTKVPRRFEIDPSFRLPKAIMDDKGQVLYPIGTLVNPLHHLHPTIDLVFINGESKKERRWLKTQRHHSPGFKLILIAGDPHGLSKKLRRPVFFDQQGILTQKLALKHTPSRVTVEKGKIAVYEVCP